MSRIGAEPAGGAVPNDFEDMWSADREVQNAAYSKFLDLTSRPVPWVYEVWDQVVANLDHRDNHNRAIAAQILSGLAVGDQEQRILDDFPRLLAVTRDERFVTARHCLQSMWRVGTSTDQARAMLVDGLERRFAEASEERNATLVRYDIVVCLRRVFDATGADEVRAKAADLIESESDSKYRKKYASAWKGVDLTR